MSEQPPSVGSSEVWGPIAWFADNSVAANLLMIILLAGGVIMAPQIKQEVFPEVSLDVVIVQVPYPGAGPEEVEQGVVLAVEEAVREVEGVDEIRSTSVEGRGVVEVELLSGNDSQEALNDVKSAVDRITSFPEDAEDPEVSLATNRRQVATVVIHGDVDRHTLKRLGEDARNELLAHQEVSVVELAGLPPPEIGIEVEQETLRRYGLSLPQLGARIAESSVELPAGSIDTSGGEILIRTTERRRRAEQFEDVAVISQDDGTRVTLGEIASIEDEFRDTDRASFFDGEPAVKVQVFRVGDQTPLEVADRVHAFVDERQNNSPEVVEYEIWDDQSEIYADRMSLLLDNSYLGLALVLVILGLFLESRVAFWTTMGIPISFLGAMLFMPALGVSLNMISLFAFLLTLGIVVDDAIVVGEAIFEKQSHGERDLASALEGTREVGVAVTFAVLTTVTAFSPMLFVPGIMGKFFKHIPLIVIPIFLVSLVEVLLILPAHLSHRNPFVDAVAAAVNFVSTLPARLFSSQPRGEEGYTNPIVAGQRAFSEGVERFVEEVYRPTAELLLEYRYVTLAASFSLLMLTGGVVGAGFIKFEFMPKIEGDRVIASVQMPAGTPVDRTRKVMDRLVDKGQEVLNESDSEKYIGEGIMAELGVTGTFNEGPGPGNSTSGSHLTQVAISLISPGRREMSSKEFSERWREKVGEIPGADSVDYQYDIGPGAGEPVAIELRHEDTEVLRRAAGELARKMKEYEGVFDVSDGFQLGKQQLELELKPAGRAAGLTETDLARQVRAAFFGHEVAREQRGRDELRIYVRRPEHERKSQYYLKNMIVRTPQGQEMELQQAAKIHRSRAATSIEREGGGRVVDVTGDVDSSVTTGGEVTASLQEDVLPEMMDRIPGLSYELSGEQQERREAFDALKVGFAIALLVMFALMAVAFRSYVQPAIIMAGIPFGIVGAVVGHLAMGFNLSLVSLFGLVALSGVVVNDSLVLVTAINNYRRNEGMEPLQAVAEGGARRFRPILLTSLTTFFGLAPMIFETSIQAQFLIPMALSLGFGVLFVTVIALIIVPALYLVLHDVKSGLANLTGGSTE